MITMEKAAEAYASDPEFRRVVDTLIAAMLEMQYTPMELRAAAMFAAIRVENERVRPYLAPLPSFYRRNEGGLPRGPRG